LFPGAIGGLVCGSAAGLCAKVVVYPLDVIKKRLQVQGFEYGNVVVGSSHKYRGLIDCAQRIVRLEGVRALYNGLSPSLFKAVVTTGLHFSTYEYSLLFVRRIYYVSQDST
jgi:solute carrier family 25 (mitochondrial thiamine pyrophosphate transporter), member 19